MDVVYILGSGSLSKNEEIRYSLRALSENMLDLGKVYIIGEDPGFLPGARHISAKDSADEKWKNAYNKIVRASCLSDISEEFLLMNDDFFMIEPFVGAEFPFYALKGSNGGPCGPNSFHMHCPIRLKKEWYYKMPFSTEQKSCKSPRTFYANFYKCPPKFADDFILRAGEGCRDFNEQIKGHAFFSIGDHSMLHAPFVEWLREKYPNPSVFEIA